MTFYEIAAFVMSGIEIAKRFIPDKYRGWANPALAVILGLGMAYLGGGTDSVKDILFQGLGAAGTAMGEYKLPKLAGQALGTEEAPKPNL